MATQIVFPVHEYFTPLTAERTSHGREEVGGSHATFTYPSEAAILAVVVQLLAGTVIFTILLGLPVVDLYLAARYVGNLSFAQLGFRYFAYATAALDLFLYVSFLYRAVRRTLIEL